MATDARTRRLQAAEAASRLLVEAGVDQTRQVDVFGLCEELGLWLAFFPLDGLLGAYLPEGSGGALITTQRPVAVQRYTAAHELGHWRLDHGGGPVLDGDEQILGQTPDESEQLAQVFAAALLMPPPLVYGTLERFGTGSEVSPVHAYMVAREAGVSYEAAVRQLANLQIIGRFRVQELLKTKPLKVKTEVGLGQRPVIGTADVWPVDEQWDGQQLRIHADDEVVISLPENRSTGYRWFFEHHEPSKKVSPEPPVAERVEAFDQLGLIDNSGDLIERLCASETQKRSLVPRAALNLARGTGPVAPTSTVELDNSMTLVGDRYITTRAPASSGRDTQRARLSQLDDTASSTGVPTSTMTDAPAIGGTGRRVLNVRLHRPGSAALRLKHLPAFGAEDHEVGGFAIKVDVEPRRRGLSIEQLLTVEDPDWAEHVRERQCAYTGSDLRTHRSDATA